MFQFPTKTA